MKETLIRILAPYVGDIVETVVEEVAEAIENERMRADGRTYRDGFEAGRHDMRYEIQDILAERDGTDVDYVHELADFLEYARSSPGPTVAKYLRKLADIADLANGDDNAT